MPYLTIQEGDSSVRTRRDPNPGPTLVNEVVIFMQSTSTSTAGSIEQANMAAAVRFIEGFNSDDWNAVREVVAPDFVFHHPLGGTIEAGPEGMVATWAGFKVLSPDSWHPIPVMIAEGDYVAVLLPTYGHFTGVADMAPPPTGGRLDYGMVNMVRVDDGRLAEMWFGWTRSSRCSKWALHHPCRRSSSVRSSQAT